MRRASLVALVVLATGPLSSLPSAGAGGGEPIKIGAISILSGPVGEAGQDAIRGAELAVKEINDAGGLLGGRDLELVVADDQADPAISVQAATRLIQEDGVSALLGPISSGPAIAVTEVASRNRVPMIAFNAGARELTASETEFVFRTYPILQDSYATLAEYAVEELGHKKVAYLGWNETAGRAAAEGFAEGVKKAKGDLVGEEFVGLLTPDLSAEIGRLREENPDAVAIGGPMPLGGSAVKQIREAGWDVQILGWLGWYTTGFATFTGSASDGMVMTAAFHPDAVKTKVGKKFLEAFEAENDRPPRDGEAVGYDAVQIAAAGIRKAKSDDPIEIAEAIHKLKKVEGVKINYRWTKIGDLKGAGHPVVFIEWQGGQQQLLPG